MELPVDAFRLLFDYVTPWRCLVALLDERTDIDDGDMAEYQQAVQTVQNMAGLTKPSNVKARLGMMLKQSEFYAQRVSVVDTRANTMEMRPMIEEVRREISSGTSILKRFWR